MRGDSADDVVLLAPVMSYYLAFINVILYNYDRFVLPICLILAIFGGLSRGCAPSDGLLDHLGGV